jgi:hypothetical protein
MMRSFLSVAAVLALSAFPIYSQQRPLRTDDAEPVKAGWVRTEFGLEFLQGQKYTLSGLEGDLTRVGVTGLFVGIGDRAEFQLSGSIHDFLSVTKRTPAPIPPDFGGDSTSDFGDLVLATKLKLVSERELWPATAFKFAVQLPIASNESGLGTDTTKFYGSLLMTKNIGRTRLLGNVGLAILDSAVQPNSQADLVTYGAAIMVPVHPNLTIVAEINGRGGPERLGNESSAQARAGIQLRAGRLRWDLAAVAGLEEVEPDSGVAFGVTYEFQAFGKTKGPRTIK